MSQQPLKRVTVSGFKSIRDLSLDLGSLNVLIGANGAGKSNFISLFRLLNEVIEGRFQLAVTKGGGADSFLYFGKKRTQSILVKLEFGYNGYECEWVPTATDSLVFASEVGYFYGDPVKKQKYGSGHLETLLPQFAKVDLIPTYVLRSLKEWKVYHFHDTSDSAGMKGLGDINDNQYFRPDASNLAAFLLFLRTKHSGHYETIVETIRMVAPFFNGFILRSVTENPGKIRLEWLEKDSDSPFMAHHLSDGTLRFICLATLLLQPHPPDTILIDEPELGLHPYAITVLAGLMRAAATRTQVIVSTQSVALVNEFEPEDLIVVNRKDQQSVFERINKEKLSEWLDEYSLGDLWQKNVLGGRPAAQ